MDDDSGKLFEAILQRDNLNLPVIEDDAYTFIFTHDSSILMVPLNMVNINGEPTTVKGYNEGTNEEYSILLKFCQTLIPDPPVTIENKENEIEQTSQGDAHWGEQATKLLIALYPEYRQKVKERSIKTYDKMWLPLTKEINKMGYFYSEAQCKNKWKTLERAFKKKVDNNKGSGRGRKECAYQNELKEIFIKRSNVFPEAVMGTGPPKTKKEMVASVTSTAVCATAERSTPEGNDDSSNENAPSTSSQEHHNKKPSKSKKRVRERSVADEIRNFRSESAKRQKAREDAVDKREIRKIEALEEKNRLLQSIKILLEKVTQSIPSPTKEPFGTP